MGLAWIDALVFTSIWAAAVAAALCAASAHAMQVSVSPASLGLAVAGTLVVYNIDRLRDLHRDFATTPERSAFIQRNQDAVRVLTWLSALAAAGFAWAIGIRVAALLVPVLGLGLFHRRLKRIPFAKPAYITFAWVAVVVGLPALVADHSENWFAVASVVALSISANIIASNVRDDETAKASFPPERALGVARALAFAGCGVALVGADAVRPLVCVPLFTAAALSRREMTESYGLVVVDGALLAGALGAIAMS